MTSVAEATLLPGHQGPAARRHIRPLISLFLAVMGGMAVYEGLKMLAFPHAAIWVSHLMTIGISGVTAVVAGYFVVQRNCRLLERAGMELRERKQAEDQLRKLSCAVEQSPAIVVITDLNGNIEYVNPKFSRVTGYTREEALGKNPRILKSGELNAEAYEKLWRTITPGGEWRGEFHNKKKNGELYWESAVISPIRNSEGVITHFLAVKEDITERKRAEAELKEERHLLQTLMDNLPDTIYFKDRASQFIRINTALANKFELSHPAQAVGKTDFDFHSAEHAQKARSDEQEIIRTGQPLVGKEEQVTRPDGSMPWFSITKMPLRDANGNIIGTFGVSRDITIRKRAEAALKEERHLHHMLMDNLPDLIYFKDRESRFTRINLALMEKYGLSDPGQAIGKTDFDFYPAEQAGEFKRDEEEIIRTGQPIIGKEEMGSWRDGHVTWVTTTKMPLRDADGNIMGTFGVSRDITIRKRAEEELRESEERYRLLFERNMAGVFRTTLDGRILDCNCAMANILGYASPLEAPGHNVLELYYSAEDRANLVEKLKAEGRVTNYEMTLRRKEGSPAWLMGNINLVPHGANSPPIIEGTFIDITKRKVAEAENAHLALVVNSSDDAIFSTNREGIIATWNVGAEGVYGYTAEEIKGKHLFILIPENRQGFVAANQEKLCRGGAFLHFEAEHVRKDGSKIQVMLTLSPIKDALGVVTGASIISRDITSRKQAEGELRERESVLCAITDSAQDAILMMDPQGRVSFWNQAAERILGYAREEALGRGLHELLAPKRYLDAHRRQFPEFLRTGCGNAVGKSVELDALRKDGREINVALSLSAVQIKDGWHAVGILRDITEQKRAEVELRLAKEAAEAASRVKSEFLANMSHEIRTPMNGIMGMTELALDTPLNSEQREYLTMAKDSADSLLALINDILDFSKIEAGKLSLDPTEFNLNDVLANTLRSLSVRASQKGLEIAWGENIKVPERVIGDAGRLRQVIVNLVGNAIKFTEQGEVAVGLEVESQQGESLVLHFTVRDTGIGIAPEAQECIFEAFTQADNSMNRKYGGTGLGLTISSRLVQMMGGKIWLDSTLGEGTTFHFTARFSQAKGAVPESLPTDVFKLRDLSVLVVDDNFTNRRILDGMLKRWSMRPEMVSNGEAGIAALERAASAGSPFPLVLLDARMPEMDGFTLAERIRQNPKLAGSTIVMLTSAGQRGDAARCRELGIAIYLIKPIRQSDLLEAMLAALGKSSQDGPAKVVTRHTHRETWRRFHVLLAEDNTVNQCLAVHLLEKLGHVVTVAANGIEALDLVKKDRFDLVLMDIQMPKMDGFQTTAEIRKEEESSGEHLPIIAMTAHAMEGDRERCLAAGMDGYVAKPIRFEDLAGAIESLGQSPEVPGTPATATPRQAQPIDAAAALARVEGDAELLQEMVALFFEELPGLLTSVRDTVMAGDAKAMERAAHKLKGSVGNFAAQPAVEAALRLEEMGRRGDLTEVDSAYQALLQEIEPLKSALNGLVKMAV
jgi:PAS domain S-box-containing protein